MSASTSGTFAGIRGQAASLLQEIVEQATNRTLNNTRDQQGRAARLMRPVRRSTTLSARDIALNAAGGAIELWQATRDRTEGTVGSVQAAVSDSASDVRSGAIGLTAQGIGAARSVSDSVAGSARSVGSAVTGFPVKVADTSKSAANASFRLSRDTAGLLVWTAAAGAVVYFGLLDENRRNQLKVLAMHAIDEGRAILADLNGEDGEFA